MTKGSAYDFVGLYGAILKDVSMYLPHDQKEWDRDLNRISALFLHRGEPVFTIDFPALGKCLDLALAKGRLEFERYVNHSGPRHPNTKIPRLFWGLWSRLFNDDGCLKINVDPVVVQFLRTLLYVGKNLETECSPKYRYETIGEFYDVDSALPPSSPVWDTDGSDVYQSYLGHISDLEEAGHDQSTLFRSGTSVNTELLDTIQRVADKTVSQLGYMDPAGLSFRHGPGAVSDLPRSSYKYWFKSWSERLESIFPWDLCGTTALGQGFLSTDLGRPGNGETHSELIAVPKSAKGPRLIAKEPTAHQWIQQGIRGFLQDRYSRTSIGPCIDFNSQWKSRELALAGSIDGSLATIDLKSASDRISCQLVQRIFRKNGSLLGGMIACRTRYLKRERRDTGRELLYKLRKFSTQGSALTFPVQSIIFAIVCVGVGKHLHPRKSEKWVARQVRVFGDDIIVPNSWEPLVRKALEILGLKVNTKKTFTEGNFRESCGMDAFRGYDVTPPHILHAYKESEPRTLSSVVAVSNNFYKRGFWNASAWLVSTIPPSVQKRLAVVSHSSGVFGLISFTGSQVFNAQRRWNRSLHRWESKILCMTAQARTIKQDTAASLLQYFTEEPLPYIDFESGVTVAGVPVIRHTWVPDQDLCIA